MVFGDGQLFLEFVPEIRGVDHRRVFVDCVGDLLRRIHQNQFCPGQPDGTVKGAAASDHDDFMLQAGRIRKLPDVLIVRAGHASGGSSGHGSCRTGSDDAGFGPRQFGKALAYSALQIEHIDKVLRRFQLGLANFRKFERAAQISPRAATIDHRRHAKTFVDILARAPADGGPCLRVQITRSDLG